MNKIITPILFLAGSIIGTSAAAEDVNISEFAIVCNGSTALGVTQHYEFSSGVYRFFTRAKGNEQDITQINDPVVTQKIYSNEFGTKFHEVVVKGKDFINHDHHYRDGTGLMTITHWTVLASEHSGNKDTSGDWHTIFIEMAEAHIGNDGYLKSAYRDQQEKNQCKMSKLQ
ncbi:hypothetical protein [Alloalcanivorax xenomutans]